MTNPSEKSCWVTCRSCYRCADKGAYAKCNSCSGRHDPRGRRDPYQIDDRCRCKEGILQVVTIEGQFIQRKFASDPFAGKVMTDAETQDERDWNQFIAEKREALNDPNWDPITIEGESTRDRMERIRRGR